MSNRQTFRDEIKQEFRERPLKTLATVPLFAFVAASCALPFVIMGHDAAVYFNESSRYRKLQKCFSAVTKDMNHHSYGTFMGKSLGKRHLSVTTRENGHNLSYRPELDVILRDTGKRTLSILGPGSPVYDRVNPTDKQYKNLEGFRTCLGLQRHI